MSESASHHSAEKASNLITLIRCESISEADDIVLELAAAGIPYFLPDKATIENGDADQEIRIQVSADNYPTAKELLFGPTPLPDDPAEQNADPAQVPLSGSLRCLAFFSPLLTLPAIFILYMARDSFSKKGYKRKADEFACGFLIGLIFWIIVVAVLVNRSPAQ